MARTFTITNGGTGASDSVNLINLSTSGIVAQKGGFGQRDVPILAGAITEEWKFNLRGTNHDHAASQVQLLTKLGREAGEFQEEPWRTKPIYLKVQTTNETNSRYAMIHEVRDLAHPDLFDHPFELEAMIEGLSMTVVREHPWRSAAPNTLPSPMTLGTSDGAGSPTLVHIANFRDDGNLTHVFSDDGGAFSANLISAASTTALWPAVPVANDALYLGSTDIAFKHAMLTLVQAGNQNWDLALEYYNGADYNTALTLGTDYTLFRGDGTEITSLDDLFAYAGILSINLFPPANWATVAVNGVTAYWLRIRVTAFTSGATIPQKDGSTIYSQRKNYVEIPAASLKGDSPQTTLIRLFSPSGGGATVGKANLSRILIGAKSNPASTFEPVLNLGNSDNPAAWSTAYGTDSSAVADNAAPGRAHCAVSFATEATSVVRATLTGDDILSSYAPGEYTVMVRCQQIGGAPGDISVGVEVGIVGSASDDPHVFVGDSVPTLGADDGPEVLIMGSDDEVALLQLPFDRAYNSDSLASVDLILKIYAERVGGSSATLRLYDIFLMPIHEGGGIGLDDPVSDTASGSSALRGGCILDVDGGVLANRTMKSIVVGGNLIPVEGWFRYNRLPDLKNIGVKTRLYFLMLHYAVDWESAPLVASLGNHLACQVYAHARYSMLRGAD
jgi:hypothetical protein